MEWYCKLSFGPFSSGMGTCPGSFDYLHLPPYVWSFMAFLSQASISGFFWVSSLLHPSAFQLHDFVDLYHMIVSSLTYTFILLVNFCLFKINYYHISRVGKTLCLVHHVTIFAAICSHFTVSHLYLNPSLFCYQKPKSYAFNLRCLESLHCTYLHQV